MRAHWHALHANLVRATNRLDFQSDFRAIRQRRTGLSGFADAGALLDYLHAADGIPEDRNILLAELAVEARDPAAETALVVLILALWPGLDAVHGRLRRYFRSDPERLVSEIATRITLGIRRIDLDRVTRIAATLIRNVERDIRRMLRREWEGSSRTVELTDLTEAEDVDGTSAAAFPSTLSACPDKATAALGQQLERLIGADAALVLAIAVLGEPQRDAAQAAGLTYETARKRYQRALAKLRPHFEL